MVRNHRQEFEHEACVSLQESVMGKPSCIGEEPWGGCLPGDLHHFPLATESFPLLFLSVFYLLILFFPKVTFTVSINICHELWAPLAIFVHLSQHPLCNNYSFCKLADRFLHPLIFSHLLRKHFLHPKVHVPYFIQSTVVICPFMYVLKPTMSPATSNLTQFH